MEIALRMLIIPCYATSLATNMNKDSLLKLGADD